LTNDCSPVHWIWPSLIFLRTETAVLLPRDASVHGIDPASNREKRSQLHPRLSWVVRNGQLCLSAFRHVVRALQDTWTWHCCQVPRRSVNLPLYIVAERAASAMAPHMSFSALMAAAVTSGSFIVREFAIASRKKHRDAVVCVFAIVPGCMFVELRHWQSTVLRRYVKSTTSAHWLIHAEAMMTTLEMPAAEAAAAAAAAASEPADGREWCGRRISRLVGRR
jgi:hypothetical protein